MSLEHTALEQTLRNLTRRLLEQRNAAGHWEGMLSSSALSTATAVSALSLAGSREASGREVVRRGLEWLARHQNSDGGWGDTVLSLSNISTTALGWATFAIAGDQAHGTTVQAAARWLCAAAGSLEPPILAEAIAKRYGKDRTFSVPILMVLALGGKLGPSPEAWRHVPALPFELAAAPQRWFQWLRLPVVSYALPALIAIGQARHQQRPALNPFARMARGLTRERTLRILEQIQPSSGGFLEATPLTSFVVMALAAAGQENHAVARHGVDFLLRSIRDDGSWPIDTNLATWTTTLAVNALANLTDFGSVLPSGERDRISGWLLNQQYREVHPYTQSPPGGWAWTDLPGGVPDADDTAGALVALKGLGPESPSTVQAASAAIRWLLDLHNRDGGIPTFCRGWGYLPFDRSSPDLTGHALMAWQSWLSDLSEPLRGEVLAASRRAVEFLGNTQRPCGAWSPLWFGNQHAPEEENLTYGTARVLRALTPQLAAHIPEVTAQVEKGLAWLLDAQNPDGGWGGAKGVVSSLEETALALEALAVHGDGGRRAAMCRGCEWIVTATDQGARTPPSPIGFYFAKLWYFEELYPLIFSVGGLAGASRHLTGVTRRQ